MASLDEIRKKLQSAENKGKRGPYEQDTSLHRHWDLPDEGASTLRFLPDKDEDNTFFWVERQIIKIPFAGVEGRPDLGNVVVQVPCANAWAKNTCPITQEILPWWNDEQLKDLARIYYRSQSYILQGFVIQSDLKDEVIPANPIRRFIFNKSLFGVIKAALLDPEMENLPIDYTNGTNFKVIKTKKGQWADYATSRWMRNESALTAEQLAAIEEHGLNNLADFLPKRPGHDELVAIKEMFETSVDGGLYDPARWANIYKPFGLDNTGSSAKTEKPEVKEEKAPVKAVKAPVVDTDDEPPFEVKEKAATDAPKASAQDILARLRERNNG